MADKFINLNNGLTAIKTWVTGLLANKQDTLVSGTNIKTVNNTSLLGSGNIDVSGGGGTVDTKMSNISTNAVQNKVIKTYVDIRSILHVNYGSPSTSGDWEYIFNESVPICIDSLPVSTFPIVIAEREVIQNGNAVKMYGLYNDEQVLVITASRNNGWSYEIVNIGGTIDTAMSDSSTNAVQNNTIKAYVDIGLSTKADTSDLPSQATDSTLGTIKTNSSQNITLNANGQLEVGGRLGQFPTTTGIFAPNNRDPRNVNNYSFLITDAMGMDMTANRSMAVVSGLGLACRSAAAGSTEYRIQNTYANRIQAILCAGGYAARDEATSTQQRIIPIVSVTINGSSYIPDSSPNPSGTASDIIIKTAETLNPDTAITNIRLFGKMGSYATLHAGNGIKSDSGGRNLLLGGGVTKDGSSNDNCLIGNGIYSSGNGNACFGRYHIARKNRGFFAGTGHDSTNAPAEGASAVGQYSYMDASTLFAVGNGSSHTDRKNAFEVRSDGIVLRSPNGTRFKLSVDDSGNLTTTAV